ncbi:MAG: hypothetical protein EPO68_15565 [Planctomycetota bacterium]|nr:MAG: hypothetical protein EPO68_15565 [Planctomycetota bacterium]
MSAARLRSAIAGATRPNGEARPAGATRTPGADLSFRALLDGLSTRARELEAGAHSVATPRELAGAVERSRDATREAAELAEGLLEAFRQSRQVEPRQIEPREASRGGRS